MDTHMRLRFGVLALGCLVAWDACGQTATQEPRPAAAEATSPAGREAAIAQLRKKGVSLHTRRKTTGGGVVEEVEAVTLMGGQSTAAEVDANLRLVAQIPEVETVRMYGGAFSADGLAALAALPRLHTLSISSPGGGQAVFAKLSDFKTLKSVHLSEYPFTDEVLVHVGKVRGLKKVQLTSVTAARTNFSTAGLTAFLNSVEDLEELVLPGAPIDDACMARIGSMKNMQKFWTDSPQITSKAWSNLAGMTNMRDLYVRNTSFDDAAMAAVADMVELRSLMLDGTKVTDKGMKSLAGLVNLTDLGLYGTAITDESMVHLAGMKELHNLYVGETKVTAKGLENLPRKEAMSMMRVGAKALTITEYRTLREMFPRSEIFDPVGFWNPDRVSKAERQ